MKTIIAIACLLAIANASLLGLGTAHHGVGHLGGHGLGVGRGLGHLGHGIGLGHGLGHLGHGVGHGLGHLGHGVGHGLGHLGHGVGHGLGHLGHGVGHGLGHLGHGVGVHGLGHGYDHPYRVDTDIAHGNQQRHKTQTNTGFAAAVHQSHPYGGQSSISHTQNTHGLHH